MKKVPKLSRGGPRQVAPPHYGCHLVRSVGIGSAELFDLFPGYRGPLPATLADATCDFIYRSPGKVVCVEVRLNRRVVRDEERVELFAQFWPAGLRGPAGGVGRDMRTFRRLR